MKSFAIAALAGIASASQYQYYFAPQPNSTPLSTPMTTSVTTPLISAAKPVVKSTKKTKTKTKAKAQKTQKGDVDTEMQKVEAKIEKFAQVLTEKELVCDSWGSRIEGLQEKIIEKSEIVQLLQTETLARQVEISAVTSQFPPISARVNKLIAELMHESAKVASIESKVTTQQTIEKRVTDLENLLDSELASLEARILDTEDAIPGLNTNTLGDADDIDVLEDRIVGLSSHAFTLQSAIDESEGQQILSDYFYQNNFNFLLGCSASSTEPCSDSGVEILELCTEPGESVEIHAIISVPATSHDTYLKKIEIQLDGVAIAKDEKMAGPQMAYEERSFQLFLRTKIPYESEGRITIVTSTESVPGEEVIAQPGAVVYGYRTFGHNLPGVRGCEVL